MRSLYLRIFVWFWVAMAVVAAVLIVSSPFFTRSRPALERWRSASEEALAARVVATAGRLEQRGLSGRRGGRRREHGPPVYVLSVDGVVLAGGKAGEEIAGFARRVAAAGEQRSERAGTLHLVGRPVTLPDGTSAVVVAAARRPPRLVDLLEPRFLVWRLAVLTLVVGLVCFWLARQLSAPVEGLRSAVRRLAGGDLAARAEAKVEERRDEIGDLARDFNAMAARLEGLVEAQRRLVRDVSHELRSPLARLRVAVELARQRCATEDVEPLDRIQREIKRLDELVGNLLTLSRLEAGEPPMPGDEVDLGELLRAVAEDAAFEGSERGVTVVVDAGEGCAVSGDPGCVRSAVENVVRNAVAWGGEGTEVTVSVLREGDEVVIRVADRGPGVPEEALPHIFEPFYRVEEARDRARGGAGLGLTIAARLVHLMGGAASAANREGGGLEVTLRLPSARRS